MPRQIAIVGSGVIGLTTAVVLSERGYAPVIFSREPFEKTTSAVAAAVWFPYDAEPEAAVNAWALLTYGCFRELAPSEATTRLMDADTGVAMIDFQYRSAFSDVYVPEWADIIGYRRLDSGDPHYVSGFQVRLPRIDTSRYLPYLKRRSRLREESFRTETIDSLQYLSSDFAAVMNCSGFGARDLAKDADVAAHRGQVVVVEPIKGAPAFVLDEPLTYLIPREWDCVLGGINENSESTATSESQTEEIIERCMRMAPLSARPKVMFARAGIRPARKSGVRLQAQRLRDGRPLIHNYGHGGCGISLSWGCALKAVELLDEMLDA